VLIQQRASNILTDPIWSERASPVSWLGPKRRRKPGLPMDDLPNIDAVLISHNHYDHLDLRTLHQLADRGHSTFIVAAHGARLLRSEKIEPVYELDWGESMTTSGISIHCVPALHFSARGIFDRKPFGAVTQSNFRNNSCIPRATLVSEVILRKFEKTHRNSSWLVGEMIRF
jgi:L-ascorbate metabolism protein UlaG (beta-lactamase superfamily)